MSLNLKEVKEKIDSLNKTKQSLQSEIDIQSGEINGIVSQLKTILGVDSTDVVKDSEEKIQNLDSKILDLEKEIESNLAQVQIVLNL